MVLDRLVVQADGSCKLVRVQGPFAESFEDLNSVWSSTSPPKQIPEHSPEVPLTVDIGSGLLSTRNRRQALCEKCCKRQSPDRGEYRLSPPVARSKVDFQVSRFQ